MNIMYKMVYFPVLITLMSWKDIYMNMVFSSFEYAIKPVHWCPEHWTIIFSFYN